MRRLAVLGLVCSLGSCAPGEVKDGLGPADPSPITQLNVSPDSAALNTGGSVAFVASATHQDGSTSVPAVTWSATGGSVDANGTYTAGTTEGDYAVTAAIVGGSLLKSRPVRVRSPIVSLTVSPSPASVTTGGSVTFSVLATRQNGNTLVPQVTWSATGGTINVSGVYTAGATAGGFTVTAALVGGTLTKSVSVTVNPAVSPIINLSVSPNPAAVLAGGTQAFAASATRQDGSTLVPTVTWSATGGTITAGGVYTAGATAGSYTVTANLVGGSLTTSVPVTVSAVVSPIVSLTVTPAAATVNPGATRAFNASATRQDGSTLVPSVNWSATGGTINTSGVYTAGSTPGSYRVIGVLQGGTLADTSVVTIPAPVLQAVILTPPSVSLNTGATQQFSVSGQWSNGATAAPSVTYSATGGTISSGGLYTAAGTAGAFRVIAVQQGGTLADTSAVMLTAAPPVLQAVILTPPSVSLNTGATQQFSVSGQWSNGATTAPAVSYTATGGTITTGGHYTAGSAAGSFRVIAKHQGGVLADTSLVSLTDSGSGGVLLLSEGFESANLASGGWFDVTSVTTALGARPGSSGTHALVWHWSVGMVAPQGTSRIDFPPSNSVYFSYWVKQTTNWVGSGQAYHPHMFSFLTTADDHWIGGSRTHLTVSSELLYVPGQSASNILIALQDALMIDTSKLLVDLTNVTELRAIGGYNGRPESGLKWDAYDAGGGNYTNYKLIQANTPVMTDGSKSVWHHVEGYLQLNSISGGKGQPDGVVQAWFDGAIVLDRRDIYFRTGANSTMQFRTFKMGPYIGDGSPVDQTMWIDDIEVRTARP